MKLKDINKMLKDFAEELESVPGDDDGQMNLLTDLLSILQEAASFEFHDFKNKNYAAPKIMLRNKLLALAEQVVEGRYDN